MASPRKRLVHTPFSSGKASTKSVRAGRQGTGNPHLALRFNADFVVHGKSELLLAAKVNFRCLDGCMTEKKMDLVKLASCKMAETRAGAS